MVQKHQYFSHGRFPFILNLSNWPSVCVRSSIKPASAFSTATLHLFRRDEGRGAVEGKGAWECERNRGRGPWGFPFYLLDSLTLYCTSKHTHTHTVAMSMEAVASSIIRILLFRTNARARQNSWRCPWLKFSPPSVIMASETQDKSIIYHIFRLVW